MGMERLPPQGRQLQGLFLASLSWWWLSQMGQAHPVILATMLLMLVTLSIELLNPSANTEGPVPQMRHRHWAIHLLDRLITVELEEPRLSLVFSILVLTHSGSESTMTDVGMQHVCVSFLRNR